ncbi:hypothetical protein TsFJ059_005008 [Trichoderma semiorbis]|uniref:Uncharacterized protein n=1 Tax=Trichoderma semiorbis TaxID=1491008 RepID=A0A9P8HX37_9HYPO|nr:hypothetical protein TsFJ059_005008 [Trichoderma semiorbis]
MGECDFEWIIARTDSRLDNVEAGDGKAGDGRGEDGKGEDGDTMDGVSGSLDGDQIFEFLAARVLGVLVEDLQESDM